MNQQTDCLDQASDCQHLSISNVILNFTLMASKFVFVFNELKKNTLFFP